MSSRARSGGRFVRSGLYHERGQSRLCGDGARPTPTALKKIERAVQLVRAGAKLIGTNPDLTGPVEGGIVPACKALMSPIELATGRNAYYLGKPNPLMMRHGLSLLGVSPEECAIIGDRMDTDIVAGVECGIDTVLVLSGVTTEHEMRKFPYRPRYVLSGVGDIVPQSATTKKK